MNQCGNLLDDEEILNLGGNVITLKSENEKLLLLKKIIDEEFGLERFIVRSYQRLQDIEIQFHLLNVDKQDSSIRELCEITADIMNVVLAHQLSIISITSNLGKMMDVIKLKKKNLKYIPLTSYISL